MVSTLRQRFTMTTPQAAIAAAVFAALSLPAWAQTSTAAPAMPTAPVASTAAPAPTRGHGMPHHAQHHGERAAKRMEQLKGKLALTTAQEPAWSSFTTAMHPGERPARLDRQDMASITTPERIDRMRALRAQRAAEADRRGEATKTLYAALTPAQQQTFDTETHRGWARHGDKGGQRSGDGRYGHRTGQGHPAGAHGMHAGQGHAAPSPAAAPAEMAK